VAALGWTHDVCARGGAAQRRRGRGALVAGRARCAAAGRARRERRRARVRRGAVTGWAARAPRARSWAATRAERARLAARVLVARPGKRVGLAREEGKVENVFLFISILFFIRSLFSIKFIHKNDPRIKYMHTQGKTSDKNNSTIA
jgi:hypothetical protein